MAKIQNQQTVQINAVIIPKQNIDIYNININGIKDILEGIYGDSKPVVTQFPELLLVFDPNNQVSINIIKEQNRIIIADNSISSYLSRDKSNFYSLVNKINNLITENDVKDYGFNILSIFDLKNGTKNSGMFIAKEFINKDKIKELDVVSAGIDIIYKEDNIRYDLKIKPRNNQNLEPTKSISVDLNAHFSNKKLPKIADLRKEFDEIYNNLANNLDNLI